MVYYHGSNLVIDNIDLEKSRNRVDFGKGFYLTDKYGTAKDWAIRKAALEGEGIPTVLCYEIDPNLFELSGLRFPDVPGLEWLEFICSNRRTSPSCSEKREPRHDYNWLSGPIADDKVVDVVAEYMRNEVTAEAAIERLCVLPRTYQLSLHTSDALIYVDNANVLYKQLKKGRWTQNRVKRIE